MSHHDIVKGVGAGFIPALLKRGHILEGLLRFLQEAELRIENSRSVVISAGSENAVCGSSLEGLMKTRITELFGIEHPIVLSGMSWISTPELVAAVCNAGGLGILATGVLDADQTREAVRRTRELTDRPFAANVTLYFPGNRENAEVLAPGKGADHQLLARQGQLDLRRRPRLRRQGHRYRCHREARRGCAARRLRRPDRHRFRGRGARRPNHLVGAGAQPRQPGFDTDDRRRRICRRARARCRTRPRRRRRRHGHPPDEHPREPGPRRLPSERASSTRSPTRSTPTGWTGSTGAMSMLRGHND